MSSTILKPVIIVVLLIVVVSAVQVYFLLQNDRKVWNYNDTFLSKDLNYGLVDRIYLNKNKVTE